MISYSGLPIWAKFFSYQVVAQIVSDFKPGNADIHEEFSSDWDESFVLHDSKGFEPGTRIPFDIVKQFILERCAKKRLNDRLHAIW